MITVKYTPIYDSPWNKWGAEALVDGKFFYAAGKTKEEARKVLLDQLSEFVNRPQDKEHYEEIELTNL